jgi:DNA repair exonuclease SbcCD ATPase subunit
VRSLAQRSAQAARETTAKIEGAILKTAQGVQISQKVAAALNEIVIRARQVDELASEVASASREQTQGITQINTAVGQMDKVTQSNAASAEESAAAAEELNSQAELMRQAVGQLKQLVGGDGQSAVDDKLSSKTARKAKADFPAMTFTPAASKPTNGHSHPVEHDKSVANQRRGEIPLEGDFKDF